MPKSVFFITGTGTEVGKTVISCTIGQLLNHQKISFEFKKPVASGCQKDFDIASCEDTCCLHKVNPKQQIESITKFAFQEAVAPPLALASAIKKNGAKTIEALNLESLKNFVIDGDAEVVICEGVGGIYSPMAEDCLNSDLMLALANETDIFKVVLVVGSYLGCVNHALLSIRQLQSLHLPIHSVIINDCMNNNFQLVQHYQLLNQFYNAGSYRMDYFFSWRHSLSQMAAKLEQQQWILR